ncbi:MAG TPA: DUF4349 domain-containing protein [Actinomycetota bacterium]|nr:DUF4349 domain-containing protein [Actinomycetota bacterium]
MPGRGPKSLIATAFLIALVAAGCSATGGNDSDNAGGTGTEQFEQAAPAPHAPAGGDGGGGTTTVADQMSLPGSGPSIIKDGSISLRVGDDELRSSVREIVSLAGRFGGYVTSSSVTDVRRGSADVVIRVPSENFEKAVAAIGDVGDVESQSVNGRDVSGEVVDLEARLRNARAQEAVLLRLMSQSRSIADTIRVQNTLSNVQLDIERLRGALRHLDDQTSYGTLSVSLAEGPAPVEASNILTRAWDLARHTTVAIASGVTMAAAFLIPVLLFVALAAALVVPIGKRLRRRIA